jgi:hypothetical protein
MKGSAVPHQAPPRWIGILVTAALAWPGVLHAEDVDNLSTAPTRSTVRLTIYNTEDLTLPRKTRTDMNR